MSVIPSQTNTNKDNYFFSLAGATSGVQTITAGSNVSVSGTSNVTINAVGTVATITAGSNVTVSGTSNVTINAVAPIQALTAGSNITLSGTSNVTINATVPAQGVVSYNAAGLTATGSNVAEIATGLGGDFFAITTGAYASGGDAYLMTVTAQITSATFAGSPNGYAYLCCAVGSVVGNNNFIYFPFPKITGNITAPNSDYYVTVSGVFVAGANPVTIGLDNRTGGNLGAGGMAIQLYNISFVGLGTNKNVITNWK